MQEILNFFTEMPNFFTEKSSEVITSSIIILITVGIITTIIEKITTKSKIKSNNSNLTLTQLILPIQIIKIHHNRVEEENIENIIISIEKIYDLIKENYLLTPIKISSEIQELNEYRITYYLVSNNDKFKVATTITKKYKELIETLNNFEIKLRRNTGYPDNRFYERVYLYTSSPKAFILILTILFTTWIYLLAYASINNNNLEAYIIYITGTFTALIISLRLQANSYSRKIKHQKEISQKIQDKFKK